MDLNEVFTPGTTPAYTYYPRDNIRIQQRLIDSVNTPGMMTYITGPSKSGKTALYETVFKFNRIPYVVVPGGDARTEEDFFRCVRQKLGLAAGWTESNGSSATNSVGMDVGSDVGVNPLPAFISLLAKLGLKVSRDSQTSKSKATEYVGKQGADLLLAAGAKTVVVVDDFHYIPREVQKTLAQHLKRAMQGNVKIVLVSTERRELDLVASNRDLNGRVRRIEIPQWDWPELEEIPKRGFNALGYSIDEEFLNFLKRECVYSPQLMQSLCHEACIQKGVRSTGVWRGELTFTATEQKRILENVARQCLYKEEFKNLSTVGVDLLRSPTFRLVDDSGDLTLNECLLKSIAILGELKIAIHPLFRQMGKVVMPDEFNYFDVNKEVRYALQKMHEVAHDLAPEDPCIEWNEKLGEIVINSSHFVCYLRASDCWASLSR
jgi:hypothetical protein